MKLIILCGGCGKELGIHNHTTTPLNEIKIEVIPCSCPVKTVGESIESLYNKVRKLEDGGIFSPRPVRESITNLHKLVKDIKDET